MRYSIDFPIIEKESHPMIVPDSEEFLHTFLPPGMPPYKLHLKIGGVYMILCNMCVADSISNGTSFTLLEMSAHLLKGRIIHDDP
jgi:hypothetical protein